MPDKEIQAIEKCTEYINLLDDEAKIRVIQYLVSRFNLTPNSNQSLRTQSHSIPISHQISTTDMSEVIDAALNFDYPIIHDVVRKDLPKTEVEWVLIYCLYASNFGEISFTRDDILSIYETSKRKSETRTKNLSHNLSGVIKKDWIKSLNDSEFIILEEGINYSQEILKGNSTTKQRKAGARKSKEKDNGSAE